MVKILHRFYCFILIIIFGLGAKAQDNASIEKVEQAVDKYLTYFSNENPGAVVMVMKNDDVIFNKAYGMSNVQQNEKMSVDKCFNLSQLTKAFTSYAILKLVEKNKLSLNNTITDIFNDFPEYGKGIKIRNLLNHTSGLVEYNINEIKSLDEVYAFLVSQDHSLFKPGEKWQHSNSDYALLAKIIEKVSKRTYKEFLVKNVFKKLSMKNSFLADDLNNYNVAYGHLKKNESYSIEKEISKIYGEQGIYTNSIDYSKWIIALFSGKLLKNENLLKILSVDKLNNGEDNYYYGYGWVVMKKDGISYIWHGGSLKGYTNMVLRLPDTDMTVLILSNRDGGYDFLKLAIYIAKLFDKDLKL